MSLRPYPKYKDSGFPWIEEIPSHWGISRIKNEFWNLDYKRIPLSSSERGDMKKREYDYYGASGVIDKVEDYLFDDELILIAEDGANLVLRNLPLIITARGQFWVNNHAHILKPKEGNIDYLANLLETINYIPWISGAAQPKLTQDRLMSIEIAIPPIQEQNAIALFLNAANARIRRYIRAKQKLIKLLNEQKQAIIQQAVTRGLDPDVPMKDSGVEWLGEIPAHWEVWKIGHFARLGNGSTPSRSNQSYWNNGSYPWLNSSSVNREYIESADQFVTTTALKECHLPIIPAGSLLVAITGQGKTRGMAALLLIEATINQHMAYITPELQRVSPEFLKLFLKGMYSVLRFISESSGSTRAALTVQDLKDFKVLIPPRSEQHYIIQQAKEQTVSIDDSMSNMQKEIDLIREYRTRLIADVVTGKVDVRGMAFEMPEDFDESDLPEVDDDELFEDDDELEEMLDGED